VWWGLQWRVWASGFNSSGGIGRDTHFKTSRQDLTSLSSENQVAVIVVNFNGGEHLARCMEAVKRQTRPPDHCIVVDNASERPPVWGDEPWLEGVTLVRAERNLGFAAANNLAAQLCEPSVEWIALLNPDAYPEADWLENLMSAAISRPEASSFACRQLDAIDGETLDGAGDGLTTGGRPFRRGYGHPAKQAFLGVDAPFSACGAAALYRRQTFLAVGGFDEDFFCYLEDIDLGFRMRLQGHNCLYVPDAIVRHHGSALTGRRSDFSTYHGHRNLLWVYLKNMPTVLFWAYLPQHLLVSLASFLACSRRGQISVFMRAKWDGIKDLRAVLRKRQLIQKNKTCRIGLIDSSLTSEISLILERLLVRWRRHQR